jgi:hypothetical protein
MENERKWTALPARKGKVFFSEHGKRVSTHLRDKQLF